MQRAWVEFWTAPQPGWAHGYLELHRWVVEKDPSADPRAPRVGRWEPPLTPVPGRGWPRIFVELDDGVVLEFVSRLELAEAARVLDLDLVDPVTAKARWYRKLPAGVKSARGRHRAAARIREAAEAFERRLPALVAEPAGVPPPSPREPVLVGRADLLP